jgi:hypothetical protein
MPGVGYTPDLIPPLAQAQNFSPTNETLLAEPEQISTIAGTGIAAPKQGGLEPAGD